MRERRRSKVVQQTQEILTNIERGEFTPAGEPSIAQYR